MPARQGLPGHSSPEGRARKAGSKSSGTVPVGGSISFSYTPIFLDDISSALEGRTAALSMTFRARTVAGDPITLITGDTLSVNACSSPPPDPEP